MPRTLSTAGMALKLELYMDEPKLMPFTFAQQALIRRAATLARVGSITRLNDDDLDELYNLYTEHCR